MRKENEKSADSYLIMICGAEIRLIIDEPEVNGKCLVLCFPHFWMFWTARWTRVKTIISFYYFVLQPASVTPWTPSIRTIITIVYVFANVTKWCSTVDVCCAKWKRCPVKHTMVKDGNEGLWCDLLNAFCICDATTRYRCNWKRLNRRWSISRRRPTVSIRCRQTPSACYKAFAYLAISRNRSFWGCANSPKSLRSTLTICYSRSVSTHARNSFELRKIVIEFCVHLFGWRWRRWQCVHCAVWFVECAYQ